jgi:dihydroorotase
VRDCPTTAQMAKSEAVVAVDKHPFMVTANGHAGVLSLNHANRLLHKRSRREMIFS